MDKRSPPADAHDPSGRHPDDGLGTLSARRDGRAGARPFRSAPLRVRRCAEDLRVVDLIREESGRLRLPACACCPCHRPSTETHIMASARRASVGRCRVAGRARRLSVACDVPALEELGEPRAISGCGAPQPTRGADVIVPIAGGSEVDLLACPTSSISEPTRR